MRSLSLSSLSLSGQNIEDHMRDFYGSGVSADMVSNVTDKIMPLVTEWQPHPLGRIYSIVYNSWTPGSCVRFRITFDNTPSTTYRIP
ncbi:MAG: transposase [Bacillota bacterium]